MMKDYLEDKGIGSLSGFVERVIEIHDHNLSNYPETKPTLQMAYIELIADIIEEHNNG